MLAVAHDARLDMQERGAPYRVHLAKLLESPWESTRARAAAELRAPVVPDGILYLRQWSDALHGRSGVDANGLSPLTWVTLDAWANRSNHEPTPDECEALMSLDRMRRNPPPIKALVKAIAEQRCAIDETDDE